MGWPLLLGFIGILGFFVLIRALRRQEIREMRRASQEREQARKRGSHAAKLQFPSVDLARCLGCGSCVRACPEGGVLELIHGQASVVHGARCVGHGLCAEECPTAAITITLGDLSKRSDIPVLTAGLESTLEPGIFLAGEVTGYALIRTAIAHGKAIADTVAGRMQRAGNAGVDAGQVLDLCIVGAGPAGLACGLAAKERGLDHVTLEQEELGGTVAKYPRRKLVLVQPVELPLYGLLERASYTKEELLEIWQEIAREEELPIRTGVRFEGVERRADGSFEVRTSMGPVFARNVCLALGRRGTPRKLGVPGEELPKVAYGLVDAHAYENRRILIVGGGDSAAEAAVALGSQRGNEVTLSYRKSAFTRLNARNEEKLNKARERGELRTLFDSNVSRITPDHVELSVGKNGDTETVTLPNQDMFVLAGGTPPFRLLADSGISFDRALDPEDSVIAEADAGLLRSLAWALILALAALTWAVAYGDYYRLPLGERPRSPHHEWLRPAGTVGLVLGIVAVALIIGNLAYLLRRHQLFGFARGKLQSWMSSHVVTGLLALILVVVHGSMTVHDTTGGHAFLALCVLIVSGAIGRWFYGFVPHAANGRELELDEVRSQLATISGEWDRSGGRFSSAIADDVEALLSKQHWGGSFLQRLRGLFDGPRDLRRSLARLRERAQAEGLSDSQIEPMLDLARQAQRTAFMVSHYEQLRGLLASWRFVHRWVALLMVLLVVLHVVTALRYADLLGGAAQ